MIDFKKISNRYKTDPIFRQKLIKGSVGLVFVIGFIVFMNYKDNKKSTDETGQTTTNSKGTIDPYTLADTTQIIDDKNIIYNNVNNEQNKNGSEVVVNTNAVATVKDDKIDAYLQHRKNTLQSMNHTNSSEPNYNRKAYNPNPPVRANYSRTNNNEENINEEKASSSTNINQTKDEKQQEKLKNFFSNKSKSKGSAKDTPIYAVIKGDQMGIRNNQRVTLLLSKDVTIGEKTFLKNTIVYAKATFSGSRVNFTISNINQFPIALFGYDAEDGGLGLQMSESLVSESTKEIVNDQTDGLGVNDIPVVGRTLNKLIKTRNREIKVDLLNNQKLILKLTD